MRSKGRRAIALTSKYGPWGIVAGGSDGVGAAFAHKIAARGMNVVLVARRVPVLEASADDIRAKHGVEVRTVALDLSATGALAELASVTSDLEVGLFVSVGGVAHQRGGRPGSRARQDRYTVPAPEHRNQRRIVRRARRP